MDSASKEQLIYDATVRQLERMRAMQCSYHNKFFNWIIIIFVTFLLLLILPSKTGLLILPFFVVTAGMQASFYLHFCDFARTHSKHLETKINEMLGLQVLVGNELEERYFYPQNSARLGGIILEAPNRFFNVYTAHWLILWLGGFIAGLVTAYLSQTILFFFIYAFAALTWAGLNFIYLMWYFAFKKDLVAVTTFLEKNLHQPLTYARLP